MLQHTGRRFKPKTKNESKDIESKPKFKHQTKMLGADKSVDATPIEQLPGSPQTPNLAATDSEEEEESDVGSDLPSDENPVEEKTTATPTKIFAKTKKRKLECSDSKSPAKRRSCEETSAESCAAREHSSKSSTGTKPRGEELIMKLKVDEYCSAKTDNVDLLFSKSGKKCSAYIVLHALLQV